VLLVLVLLGCGQTVARRPSAAQKSSGPVNSFFARSSGLMIWNCLYDTPRLTSVSYTLRGSTILLPCVTSFQSERCSRLATEAMLYVARRPDQAGFFRERGCSFVVVTAAAPATASRSSGQCEAMRAQALAARRCWEGNTRTGTAISVG
jgi:hypothetical protein